MTPTLPASSHRCRETRPPWAALLKRPSGRSRLLRNDPSTISSPATAAADPDKPGRPRSDRRTHNHSPPALTSAQVQISRHGGVATHGEVKRYAAAGPDATTRSRPYPAGCDKSCGILPLSAAVFASGLKAAADPTAPRNASVTQPVLRAAALTATSRMTVRRRCAVGAETLAFSRARALLLEPWRSRARVRSAVTALRRQRGQGLRRGPAQPLGPGDRAE